MNKTTKASIATAAGIVLLLGGAGSLAYWTSSANTGSGTPQVITAGTLNITAQNSGSWTKGLYDNADVQKVAPVAVTLGDVRLVPGNKLVYTQTFNVTATGQDLYFTVSSTNGALGTTTNGLAGRLTSNFSVGTLTSSGSTITLVSGSTYRVAASAPGAAGTATITVTWTVNWPFGDSTSVTNDNNAKLGTVTLTEGAVTLTQVTP